MSKKLISLFGGCLLSMVAGCAADYHAYPCGAVSCQYCAPPPLPYARFESCHTPLTGSPAKQADAPLDAP